MSDETFITPQELEGYKMETTGERLVDLFPNGLLIDFAKGEVKAVRENDSIAVILHHKRPSQRL